MGIRKNVFDKINLSNRKNRLSIVLLLVVMLVFGACGRKVEQPILTTSHTESITTSKDESTTGKIESPTTSKDESTTVGKDESTTVGKDESTTVSKDESTTVGKDESTTTGKTESTTTSKDESTTTSKTEYTTTSKTESTTTSKDESTTTSKVESTTTSKTESTTTNNTESTTSKNDNEYKFDLSLVPEFNNYPYYILNSNVPCFTDEEKNVKNSFEFYSPLDNLGRCGVTLANVGLDIMPTEDRGEIGMVKPTGWHTVKYDIVDGKYLYNRCHLIGFQLTGENANVCNLITGTRYMNVDGMLPFENAVDNYIERTGNHVLYRVTPIFVEDELVARGVVMEAWSVEDNGMEICFNIFVYNNQPGVIIDYKTGESRLIDGEIEETTTRVIEEGMITYVLNISSKKFHYPTCTHANSMSEDKRKEYTCYREDLIADGYSPCGVCKP